MGDSPARAPERSRLANSARARYETRLPPIPMDAPVAAIAQLVEHLIRNEGVGGSNPSCGTNFSMT